MGQRCVSVIKRIVLVIFLLDKKQEGDIFRLSLMENVFENLHDFVFKCRWLFHFLHYDFQTVTSMNCNLMPITSEMYYSIIYNINLNIFWHPLTNYMSLSVTFGEVAEVCYIFLCLQGDRETFENYYRKQRKKQARLVLQPQANMVRNTQISPALQPVSNSSIMRHVYL